MKEIVNYFIYYLLQVNNRLREAHQELEDSDRKHNLILKKHKEDLADIMKLHDEEKFQLKKQLEDARLDYLKEIENVHKLVYTFIYFIFYIFLYNYFIKN